MPCFLRVSRGSGPLVSVRKPASGPALGPRGGRLKPLCLRPRHRVLRQSFVSEGAARGRRFPRLGHFPWPRRAPCNTNPVPATGRDSSSQLARRSHPPSEAAETLAPQFKPSPALRFSAAPAAAKTLGQHRRPGGGQNP